MQEKSLLLLLRLKHSFSSGFRLNPNDRAHDTPLYFLVDWGRRPSSDISQLGAFGASIFQRRQRHLNVPPPHFLNRNYASAFPYCLLKTKETNRKT